MNENSYRARASAARCRSHVGDHDPDARRAHLAPGAGLDFVRVDMEHSAFSMETVADMATLGAALDFPMVVRLPRQSEWVTRCSTRRVESSHPAGRHAGAGGGVARESYAPWGARHVRLAPHPVPHAASGEHMATANAARACHGHARDEEGFERVTRSPRAGIDALTIVRPIWPGPGVSHAAQKDALRDYRVRLAEAARNMARRSPWPSTAWRACVRYRPRATIVNYSSDTAVLRSGFASAIEEIRRPAALTRVASPERDRMATTRVQVGSREPAGLEPRLHQSVQAGDVRRFDQILADDFLCSIPTAPSSMRGLPASRRAARHDLEPPGHDVNIRPWATCHHPRAHHLRRSTASPAPAATRTSGRAATAPGSPSRHVTRA